MDKKSLSTMARIGAVRDAIEHDLQQFERMTFDYVFMVYYDSVGVVVPHNWILDHPMWKDEYDLFMSGQTVCVAGVYHRDVLNFLNIIESKCSKDSTL